MFSHPVELRKWIYDIKTTDLHLVCYSDGRILFKSPVSSWDAGTFSLKMEKSSTGEKKPDSRAFICRLCQYTHDGHFSRQDIRYLHICWISCRLLRGCTARRCARCRATRQSVQCNRESSPSVRHINNCPVKASADRSHITILHTAIQ